MNLIKHIIFLILCSWLANSFAGVYNNPHQGANKQNVLYSAFTGPPKTLDPARSYSADETQFVAQIYEPPLQYHYLKRPYELIPLGAAKMPLVRYYNKQGILLPLTTNPNEVAYSTYDITIKPGVFYQPHPAFAKNHPIQSYKGIHNINDFKQTGTRELTAEDYVYEIKRLASPRVNSPIFGVMDKYIVGFDEYAKTLAKIKNKFIDLRQYPLEGAKAISRYEYQIKIKGAYPQFKFWLAMPFFAPIPWEADAFYSQKELKKKNITLDWYPIGTGPYYLAENNPNKQMVLKRNPNFHRETYPTEGEPGDKEKGYLQEAGKLLPFIDTVVFSLDKESIPRWNKFLQGYYDKSGISADSFDQAIRFDKNGNAELTDELKKKGVQLKTTINPSVFYMGFNMQDDTVGGYSEKNKKLRQAISIALDYEEYISIFLNGRGISAESPLAPGIFGYRAGEQGINKIVYRWDGREAKRKSLDEAKKFLAEAGYPGGIDPKTKQPLILNYDVTSTGGPDDKSLLNWTRKQFNKLGIKLNIRSTEYNRFRDKVRTGNAQIFSWGWLADYPDPENFFFLLYGPNSMVKTGGENATNYNNPEFNRLFEKMRDLPDGPERQKIIDQMTQVAQEDSPWIWGVHPIDFTLSHVWNSPSKPLAVANNLLKYQQLNPQLRATLREKWNKPITWPLWVLLGFVVLLMIPLSITYWRREHHPTVKRQ